MTFYGFERPDGSIGIRNYVAVIPSVVCSVEVARKIAANVRNATILPHDCGCTQVGEDKDQTFRVLSGLGMNPNVYGVLVVGLGCETISADSIADEISKTGKPVYQLNIQDEGSLKAVEKGTRILKDLSQEASKMSRRALDIPDLIVGTECGGSDWTSGVTANPAVGKAMDMIVERGGTAVLSETTEFIGAEHLLADRAVDEVVRKRILEFVERYEKEAIRMGVDIRGAQPTPGNIDGGITTIEEKSLGAIHKGGASRIVDVVKYGERIREKGLVVMDTPGYDVESVTGMVAGGAQIVVFTTGRGSPVGNAIAPVIKVTGNPETYRKMRDNIDINASKVFEGKSLEEVAEEIFNEILEVASGKLTKAEILGHNEIGIWRIGWSL
jgi:altronate dehydratase large subunit